MAARGRTLLVSDMLSCSPRTLTHKTLSEVAFVGKAIGTYLMLLGGGYHGQRLNKIYRGRANFFYYLALFSDPYCPIFT